MAASIRQISSQEIKLVLKYEELIPQMERALHKFSFASDFGVDQPVRSVVRIKNQEGALGVMPAYIESEDVLTTKLVAFFPKNKNLPTHNAVIMVFNPENGVPTGILDAGLITEMRTAAVSAVASKYLAKPDSSILAIIGSGAQARSHYYALSHIFQFKEVRIYSRNFSNAEKLSKEVNGRACHSAEEAVKDADIITTVTSSRTPILYSDWIKPGVHINAVGACLPDIQEIDTQIMQKATIYVDSKEAAMKESGDIILGKANIYAEMGEVIAGTKECNSEDTTLFKSLGLAVEDALTAKLVLSKV